jgi:hypothetical protein
MRKKILHIIFLFFGVFIIPGCYQNSKIIETEKYRLTEYPDSIVIEIREPIQITVRGKTEN